MKSKKSKKSSGLVEGIKLHDKHLAKVKKYVANDMKEDKLLLKENVRINKDLHRGKK